MNPTEEANTHKEEESDVQMALRLMRTLDYRKETLSHKRSYVLERWPENYKKHKTLGFFTEECVPECDVRDEKDISFLKSLVEESMEILCGSGEKNDNLLKSDEFNSSLEPSVRKMEEISDLELFKRVPLMLNSLNKKALKVLFISLTGKQLTSNHRYIFEREIASEFLKLLTLSCEQGLPEYVQKMVSVLRGPTSYRHTLGSINPNANLINTMPSSPLAAAREAFALVGNLPTRTVMEVGKLLISEDNKSLPLSFRHKTHVKTVQALNQEVERRLGHLQEGDLLPACMEGALHAISLSARMFFGRDGGLARLLKPLSPEILALEKAFQAAYNEVDKLNIKDLSNISNGLRDGLQRPPKKKQFYIDELQQFLIDSMHCIYAYGRFPETVRKVVSMINDLSNPATEEVITNRPNPSTHEVTMEGNHGNSEAQEVTSVNRLSKDGKGHNRLHAELDSVLDVSAQVRSAIWECYESFVEATEERKVCRAVVDAERPAATLDPAEVTVNHNPEIDGERNQSAVKTETEIPQDETSSEWMSGCSARRLPMVHEHLEHYVHNVEAFSDEAAATVYVLIGHLLKDVALQQSLFLDSSAIGYLNTGLHKLQGPSSPLRASQAATILLASSHSFDAIELVLSIAKKLKAIPQRVILEAERQLRHHRCN